ncbi:MAG: dockerin type I repeat-containing protein [Clostridia bacterium]|nr:dockerin type I repeat-containing protein [Clostridia bacterium]
MKRLNILVSIVIVCAVALGGFALGALGSSSIAGDVDFDGKVTAEDALLVLRASADLDMLTAEQRKAADVTYDSKVNSVDALRILLYISGNISDLGNIGSEEGDDIII